LRRSERAEQYVSGQKKHTHQTIFFHCRLSSLLLVDGPDDVAGRLSLRLSRIIHERFYCNGGFAATTSPRTKSVAKSLSAAFD
jgi:hypothetical protein